MAKRSSKSPKQQKVDGVQRKKGAYPYFNLSTSIKLGEVVWQAGGDRIGVPKSVVASGVDMSQSSSSFPQLVASAKCFGIVDGHTELMLTDLGRDYFMPTSDGAKRSAELQFLRQPPVFQYLIDKFDGSTIPAASIMANLLGREFGIPRSWSPRVAGVFMNGVEALGVLDQAGRLRYDANLHVASTATASLGNASASVVQSQVVRTRAEEDSLPTDPHFSSMSEYGKRDNITVWAWGELRVETPDEMTSPMWQRLNNYIQILKPDEQAKDG